MIKKSSVRQIHALQLMNQGLSKRQSLIRAGYSVSTANQAKRVMHTKSMDGLIETFQESLGNVGITTDFLATKMKEWLEATKLSNGEDTPDYEVQLRAFGALAELAREKEKMTEKTQTKRKLTIEEFIAQP